MSKQSYELIKINHENKIDFAADWQCERDMLLAKTAEIRVVSASNNNEAGKLLKQIGAHSNALEKARKDYVKPIQDKISDIKALSDAQRAGLEAERQRLKKTIGAFEIAERQRLQEIERQKAMEEAAKEMARQAELDKLKAEKEKENANNFFYDPTQDAQVVQKQAEFEAERKLAEKAIDMTPQKAQGSAVKIRKNWGFEIEDVNQIPRWFLMPDMQKIGAFVRENKELTEIKGIKVICTETVSA